MRPPYSDIFKQLTQLCDRMNELAGMHYLYDQTAERAIKDPDMALRSGVSLFPNWLRVHELDMLDNLNNLQDAMRSRIHADSGNAANDEGEQL